MTTNQQPRRLRRQAGEGNGSDGGGASSESISERLRIAREARGVDLFRVERDTKIRVKYLKAMELGQFSELPGAVYARGFLRNYASYLGLDPDEAENEWRLGHFTPAVKASAAKAPMLPADPIPAPTFKMPSFKLPGVKWPAATAPVVAPPEKTAVPAATKRKSATAPAALKQAPADPSILESPPWNRRAFSLGRPAFLRRPEPKEATESFVGGPRPITVPGRALLLQPAHIVVLLLVVVVAAVGLFFGYQATRVLQDPTLTVTSPGQRLTTVSTGTTSYKLEGKATIRAEISVSIDGRDPVMTPADASGLWSYVVTLHPGVNQLDIHSTDLGTNHDSVVVTRLINVLTPTASPVPEFLTVDSPGDGAAFRDGNIIVTGTTLAITSVLVTPTYLGVAPAVLPTPKPVKTAGLVPTAVPTLVPLPTPAVLSSALPTPVPAATPVGSNNPLAVSVIPTIDGKFRAQMHLYSGRWKLTVVGTNSDGVSSRPVQLTVIVTAGSLVVLIRAKGGNPGLKIWKDGKVFAGYTPLQRLKAGQQVTIVADQSVWIMTGIPNYTYVTVNGVSYGRLGNGSVTTTASWRITAYGPPVPSNDR
jgi:hypothetical protein